MRELQPPVICRPDRAEWRQLAQENRASFRGNALISAAEQKLLRGEMLAQAAAYTAELAQRAPALAIAPPGAAQPASAAFAAGHQPICAHPGIVMKTLLMDQELRERGGTGLNVVVDIDSGDSGVFSYPLKDARGMRQAVAHLAEGGDLFLSQRLKTAPEIESVFATVVEALFAAGRADAAERSRQAARLFALLAEWPAADALTAARRAWEGAPLYCDVPLSRLLRLAGTGLFFSRMLADFRLFAETYNRVLNEYRREKRIENAANPFPNLRREGELWELPFWLIDLQRGARSPLFAAGSERVRWLAAGRVVAEFAGRDWNYLDALPAGLLLAPRALPLSLLLRFVGSDLFLHGTGGARYDACTDRFIEAYLGSAPPRYAVVSGTRYLFPSEAAEYARACDLDKRRRELYFHADKFFDQGLFDGRTQQALRDLAARRAELAAEIRRTKAAGESAAAATQAARALDAETRSLVDGALAAGLSPLLSKSAEELDALFQRAYPYFMFDRAAFP